MVQSEVSQLGGGMVPCRLMCVGTLEGVGRSVRWGEGFIKWSDLIDEASVAEVLSPLSPLSVSWKRRQKRFDADAGSPTRR
jgi:hypothetical protein